MDGRPDEERSYCVDEIGNILFKGMQSEVTRKAKRTYKKTNDRKVLKGLQWHEKSMIFRWQAMVVNINRRK